MECLWFWQLKELRAWMLYCHPSLGCPRENDAYHDRVCRDPLRWLSELTYDGDDMVALYVVLMLWVGLQLCMCATAVPSATAHWIRCMTLLPVYGKLASHLKLRIWCMPRFFTSHEAVRFPHDAARVMRTVPTVAYSTRS
jgi:hypothetical protein